MIQIRLMRFNNLKFRILFKKIKKISLIKKNKIYQVKNLVHKFYLKFMKNLFILYYAIGKISILDKKKAK